MIRGLGAVLIAVAAAAPLHAQEPVRTDQPRSEAIEDNSFFIEEAYNQEEGVVQHISTAVYAASPHQSLGCSFTQEWPLGSQMHQLSVTVPYEWVDGGDANGIGDILLNYRFQLAGAGDWAALAPRFSLIVSSGDAYDGRRWGFRGIQLNIPASRRLTDDLVAHANIGATFQTEVTPSIVGDELTSHAPTHFNAGASVIWLASPATNLLLEYTAAIVDETADGNSWEHQTEHILSPGVRHAVDIGTLQIVPGIAVPLFTARGETHAGTFFYLSFEHPF